MAGMRRSRAVIRRLGVGLAAAGLLMGSLGAGTVSAVTLTPPPPDFESCHPGGNGTVCVGNRTRTGELQPTGIWCGTDGDAFEIVDDGGTILDHFERWYDADGYLVRRLHKATWLSSAWINPTNGARVSYRQANVTVDLLTVPGDFGSAQSTTTGVVNFVVPGSGAIALNAGRTVFGADGSLEFSAGPQAILDYVLDGDAAALQPICDALSG
jgi:hypothetical protein